MRRGDVRGAHRPEIELVDCNCSMCHRTGYLHLIVPKERFSLLTGKRKLTTYTFNTETAKHLFCSVCGIKSFYVPRSHPDGYSVNFRCLDPEGFHFGHHHRVRRQELGRERRPTRAAGERIVTTQILMPALSPTMEEGKLAKWLVKEGDKVNSGDILAEIETDKATMEFEAVDEGRIGKILVPEGTEGVKVNAADRDACSPKAKALQPSTSPPRCSRSRPPSRRSTRRKPEAKPRTEARAPRRRQRRRAIAPAADAAD